MTRPTIDLLFLTERDETFVRAMKLYARRLFDAPVTVVSTIEEFADTLNGFGVIKRLILAFHGIAGSISLNGKNYILSGNRIADLFSRNAPTISRIDFDTCNAGTKPAALFPFGRLFHAKEIVGWNYYHVFEILDLDIALPLDEEMLRFKRERERYIVGGAAEATRVFSTPGSHTILLEWFRTVYSSDRPPDPSDRKARDWVSRDCSQTIVIKDEAEGAKYFRKYFCRPNRPLQEVIVRLNEDL